MLTWRSIADAVRGVVSPLVVLLSLPLYTLCSFPRRSIVQTLLMHRHLCALAASALAWSAATVNASPIDSLVRQTTLAPLYTPPPPHSDQASDLVTNDHVIRDSYIVVLDESLDQDDVAQHHAHVQSLHARHQSSSLVDDVYRGIKHTFHVGGKREQHHLSPREATASAVNGAGLRRKQLKGYSGHFPEQLVDEIRALKGVKYVERDTIVKTQDVENGAPWVSSDPWRDSVPPPAECGGR